jgi:hypothetical protein
MQYAVDGRLDGVFIANVHPTSLGGEFALFFLPYSSSQINPHVGFIAAMGADGMPFGFALFGGRSGWFHRFFHMVFCVFLQRTSDHHFSLIAAVFAFTDLFKFFFRHIVLLLRYE